MALEYSACMLEKYENWIIEDQIIEN